MTSCYAPTLNAVHFGCSPISRQCIPMKFILMYGAVGEFDFDLSQPMFLTLTLLDSSVHSLLTSKHKLDQQLHVLFIDDFADLYRSIVQ